MQSEHSAASSAQRSLQGIVERVTFHDPGTGYAVVRFTIPDEEQTITVVGTFPSIRTGQSLRLSGFWRDHQRYGPQFHAESFEEAIPATLEGIEKYLGSGLIRGIGPVTAAKIVSYFGEETLMVIEHHSERLLEVPGLAQKKVQGILDAWRMQRAIQQVMVFLQGHGVSTGLAVKIYKQYGQEAIATVTHNPYQLTTDIYGVGFATADRIALRIGVPPDSPFRYRAGVLHALSVSAAGHGDCFLPQAVLVERAASLLAVPERPVGLDLLIETIQRLAREGEVVIETGFGDLADQPVCYSRAIAHIEAQLAERILLLLRGLQPSDEDPPVREWIAVYMAATQITLSEQQQRAVELAASSRVLVLTGGPGCGKTFTIRAIVDLWHWMRKATALAAPTGRAAQRLSELTGEEASTVHRLLRYDPLEGGFRHDEQNPLFLDALVIDESSMLDLFLAHSLTSAVPPGAHLLLVGDTDQLPSVGPGNVLRDLIASGQIPVVRLTQVFRQAQASQIVTNAHRINRGALPRFIPLARPLPSDCCWVNAPAPGQGVHALSELVRRFLPSLGIDPVREVQVLSPMTKGEVGTRALNLVLQGVLNPPLPGKGELVSAGSTLLREGDRVIQCVNDYAREVFNGDVGTLVAIDQDAGEVWVRFADREVCYDEADLSEIAPAWCITIHKSQGSEYPVVILPLYPLHTIMLTRNLLYTGLTRAKRLCILVGPTKAFSLAVSRVSDLRRYTALADRLRAAAEGAPTR